MDTKSQLIDIASDLFSRYGYKGVSVRDISKVIGLKESALYKHFENKADILEHIIQIAKQRIETFYASFSYDPTENLTQVTKDFFCAMWQFYTQDSFMSRFRRIMIITQYESKENEVRYEEMFLSKPLQYYQNTFLSWFSNQTLTTQQAQQLALELYSVFYVLLQQYDQKPFIEEALEHLRFHIEAFFTFFLKEGGMVYGL